ncbi:hypothetical protein IV454_11440 [Massilia antarctica]|uniref:Uncharacterized protein n=1 Tax=Massilia antarctica TaxID=2765360 RepID=A0AA49AAB2_9BURK|nr:hypothetical protein [Massilia antarctica]QPI52051.1 hypothetical protein IV454_11440 [Massilia antarctica]
MKAGALIAALVVAAGAAWLALPQAGVPAAALAERPAAAPATAQAPPVRAVQAAGAGWLGEVPRSAPSPAWESMADARRHGDPHTPPLAPAALPGSGPSAAQLADPQAYRAYEARQEARVLAAFASAAELEVPRLQADVERARAAGISAAQIARVEEKIRRLQQLRREIAGPLPLR